MDSVKQRLTRCFAVLFPGLEEDAIHNATTSSVSDWDSIATVTLVNIVEEEFGVQIGIDEVEEMVSFKQFLDYLHMRAPMA